MTKFTLYGLGRFPKTQGLLSTNHPLKMIQSIRDFLVHFAVAFLWTTLFFLGLAICVCIPMSLDSDVGTFFGSIVFLSAMFACISKLPV